MRYSYAPPWFREERGSASRWALTLFTVLLLPLCRPLRVAAPRRRRMRSAKQCRGRTPRAHAGDEGGGTRDCPWPSASSYTVTRAQPHWPRARASQVPSGCPWLNWLISVHAPLLLCLPLPLAPLLCSAGGRFGSAGHSERGKDHGDAAESLCSRSDLHKHRKCAHCGTSRARW